MEFHFYLRADPSENSSPGTDTIEISATRRGDQDGIHTLGAL
ncbi:MAG TPA: hypothetical protein VIT23_16855 [Terrimicrobiaceae bacterium]